MRFRPCIDIHNGKVKQIVGGSLTDFENSVKENYTSDKDAAWFAKLYKKEMLSGGHIIILNNSKSEFYNASKKQAVEALHAYPKGLQIGGGINLDNAEEFLDYGASHVIVTSFIFQRGKFFWDNLKMLRSLVGKENIVIDLSCRKKDGDYYVVTDRWQTFTKEKLTFDFLDELRDYCDEFLVHGVDVEGLYGGIEDSLVGLLGGYSNKRSKDSKSSKDSKEYKGNLITYAGGIGSLENLEYFRKISNGHLDYTIGSALDIFGGEVPFSTIAKLYK